MRKIIFDKETPPNKAKLFEKDTFLININFFYKGHFQRKDNFC